MIEIWRDIKEYEGYAVSSFGRVMSKHRKITYTDGREKNLPELILKAVLDGSGYLRVRLSVKDIKYSARVNRLVAQAFILNKEQKPQVNHKNGVKVDNNAKNLEWCTNSENQLHAYAVGIREICFGVSAPASTRVVLVYDKTGQLCAELCGNKELLDFGLDYRLVSDCLKGKRRTHRGYKFKARELI